MISAPCLNDAVGHWTYLRVSANPLIGEVIPARLPNAFISCRRLREQFARNVVAVTMSKRPFLRWWHLSILSLVVSATLMLLVRRVFLPAADPPSLLRLIAVPPLDSEFRWYPMLSAAVLVVAVAKRSLGLVAFVQAALFVAGFVHVLWIVGTVPRKLDLRLLEIVAAGQAVAWTSYLCVAAALAIGLGRPND